MADVVMKMKFSINKYFLPFNGIGLGYGGLAWL
jgi:opacity protein-like surface antigen